MDRDGFRDRNDRFRYLVARENARRVADDPAILEAGKRHFERFSVPDPHQRDAVALWRTLFAAGPAEVVQRLLDRSPAGDYARETAPSFGALPASLRSSLAHASRMPLDERDLA